MECSDVGSVAANRFDEWKLDGVVKQRGDVWIMTTRIAGDDTKS